jgi:hypothetical protein
MAMRHSALLASRSPPRCSRCRSVRTENTGTGATPVDWFDAIARDNERIIPMSSLPSTWYLPTILNGAEVLAKAIENERVTHHDAFYNLEQVAIVPRMRDKHPERFSSRPAGPSGRSGRAV